MKQTGFKLLLLVSLMGCNKEVQTHYSTGSRSCDEILKLGWKIDGAACAKHMHNPKYKLGELLHFKSKIYDKSCGFIVTFTDWSPAKNLPIYLGTIKCTSGYTTKFNQVFLETDLKRKVEE